MRDYVIINGVNSLTIDGLAISKLPPITKPLIRSQREIDGRDGDIITELGYSAYDKQLEIGLFGSFDIDSIIKYFTGEGTIIFSNESDKYYNFKIINQIDYEKLLKFKTATITLHCQPFKYPVNETPIEGESVEVSGSGSNITLNNTVEAPMSIVYKGNTLQNGTPTPDSPIPIQVVSGDNSINVVGKNLFDGSKYNGVAQNTNGTYKTTTYYASATDTIFKGKPSTTYRITLFDENGDRPSSSNPSRFSMSANGTWKNITTFSSNTFDTDANGEVRLKIGADSYAGVGTTDRYVMITEATETPTFSDYEPYTSNTYSIDLGVENLLNITMTSQTTNGVQFNVNEDKSIWIKGTATARTEPNLWTGSMVLKAGTTYYNNTDTTLYLYASAYYSIGANSSYTPTNDLTLTRVYIRVENGETINKTIYPMLSTTQTTNYCEYGKAIELLKIETYQDKIFKNTPNTTDYNSELEDNVWYVKKEIGKVVLNGSETWTSLGTSGSVYKYYTSAYSSQVLGTPTTTSGLSNRFIFAGVVSNTNNSNTIFFNLSSGQTTANGNLSATIEGITTANDFKTWLGTHNTTVYYVLNTPTYTLIEDTTLISQLETTLYSKRPQTNIMQENNDAPFDLDVSLSYTDTMNINNVGNIYAKPILELEGSGNIEVVLNDIQILEINLGDGGKIAIDVPNLQAYNPDDDTLMNRLVTGDYMKLLIQEGDNTITFNGSVTSATLTKYTRYI